MTERTLGPRTEDGRMSVQFNASGPDTELTVYVNQDSPVANDINPGTEVAPFRTVQAAVTALEGLLDVGESGVVRIGPGVYTGDISIGSRSLSIIGAGRSLTRICADPAGLDTFTLGSLGGTDTPRSFNMQDLTVGPGADPDLGASFLVSDVGGAGATFLDGIAQVTNCDLYLSDTANGFSIAGFNGIFRFEDCHIERADAAGSLSFTLSAPGVFDMENCVILGMNFDINTVVAGVSANTVNLTNVSFGMNTNYSLNRFLNINDAGALPSPVLRLVNSFVGILTLDTNDQVVRAFNSVIGSLFFFGTAVDPSIQLFASRCLAGFAPTGLTNLLGDPNASFVDTSAGPPFGFYMQLTTTVASGAANWVAITIP